MKRDTKKLIGFVVGLGIIAIILWIVTFTLPEMMHHEGLEGKEAEEHEWHVGLYVAMIAFLSIAASVGFLVSLGIATLTILRFEREKALPAHEH